MGENDREAIEERELEGLSGSTSAWVGSVSVLLLSVTAIVTAWTGFQASKWGGEMSISFAQAGSTRVQAARLAAGAERTRSMQVATFSQWLVAQAQGDKNTMEALSSRFHEPLKTAFRAWLATKPLENQNAPDTPFDMSEYRSPKQESYEAAVTRADALFAEGLEKNQRGDNYTILAVLGATVLFFAAMSTRVRQARNQWLLLGTALVLFSMVAVSLVTFPKLL
jgi:uncharacterized membrane protein